MSDSTTVSDWLDRVNAVVAEVFGRVGRASFDDDDELGRVEWDSVTLGQGQPGELELSVETVPDYLGQGEPLPLRRRQTDDLTPSYELVVEHISRGERAPDESSFDFDEYVEQTQRYGAAGALLVSQRPVGFFDDNAWTLSSDSKVGLYHESGGGGWRHLDGIGIEIVAVDLSRHVDRQLIRRRLEVARDLLIPSGSHNSRGAGD